MRVAVLGTGLMGAPMARHLAAAGHEVRVWNRTRAKAEGLGAEVADTPAAAVEGAEVVITMLADGPAVDAVAREALPACRDAVWAQMSTVGVEWADRLAALAAEHGLAQVDAPVMGSRPAAVAGALTPLASGPPEARERCTRVFEAFSRSVLWLGDEPGLGSRLKLALNHLLLVTTENVAETFALAEGLGVDPAWVLDALRGAPYDIQYAHVRGEPMLRGDFTPTFALKLALKDLTLEAAGGTGVDLPLARAARERFARAIELGHGDEDVSATFFAAAPDRVAVESLRSRTK